MKRISLEEATKLLSHLNHDQLVNLIIYNTHHWELCKKGEPGEVGGTYQVTLLKWRGMMQLEDKE